MRSLIDTAIGGVNTCEGITGGDQGISRETLIAQQEQEVKKIAGALYKRRSDDTATFEDYYHFGIVGMLESFERFDPGMDVSFKTFSGYRIRGAILNGVAKMSEKRCRYAIFQSAVYQRNRSLFEGIEKADVGELVDYVIEFAISYLVEKAAIQGQTSNFENNDGELDCLREKLFSYVEQLPVKLSTIIHYHYFECLSFVEIASILEVSLSRVSQLHKESLRLLNIKLNGLGGHNECLGEL